eukprot:ctg_1121.g577
MALRRRQLPKNDAGGVPVVEDDEEAELIESDWLSEVVVDDANEWDAVVDANMSDRPRSRPVDEGTRHHRQIGDQAARGTAEAALRATHPLAGVNTDPAAGDGRSASASPAENVVDRSAPSNTGAAREAYAREKQAPRDDFERRQWALEESILQRMRASREKIARLQERIDRFPEQMEAIIRELDEHRCAGRHDLVERERSVAGGGSAGGAAVRAGTSPVRCRPAPAVLLREQGSAELVRRIGDRGAFTHSHNDVFHARLLPTRSHAAATAAASERNVLRSIDPPHPSTFSD